MYVLMYVLMCVLICVLLMQEHVAESISTLKFGERARQIRSHPTANIHKTLDQQVRPLSCVYIVFVCVFITL